MVLEEKPFFLLSIYFECIDLFCEPSLGRCSCVKVLCTWHPCDILLLDVQAGDDWAVSPFTVSSLSLAPEVGGGDESSLADRWKS